MVARITKNTHRPNSAVAPMKISVSRASMVKAMAIAPSTMNGERSSSLRVRLMLACAWFASLVSRVISVGAPAVSSSAKESRLTCRYKSARNFVPKPMEALAAKYCAVSAHTTPDSANAASTAPMRRI